MAIVWLAADYAVHSFHYRMPETAAVSGTSPLVPSPLTLKMALVGSLLSSGEVKAAQQLARVLPTAEVRIQPPAGALVFRALMRYVRPPKDARKRDEGTASSYVISPHFREICLWQDRLRVFVEIPDFCVDRLAMAFKYVGYLGSKDSQVVCCQVQRLQPDLETVIRRIEGHEQLTGGVIVRLADFARPPKSLRAWLPGERSARDYRVDSYVIPGKLVADGGTRIYCRGKDAGVTFRW